MASWLVIGVTGDVSHQDGSDVRVWEMEVKVRVALGWPVCGRWWCEWHEVVVLVTVQRCSCEMWRWLCRWHWLCKKWWCVSDMRWLCWWQWLCRGVPLRHIAVRDTRWLCLWQWLFDGEWHEVAVLVTVKVLLGELKVWVIWGACGVECSGTSVSSEMTAGFVRSRMSFSLCCWTNSCSFENMWCRFLV